MIPNDGHSELKKPNRKFADGDRVVVRVRGIPEVHTGAVAGFLGCWGSTNTWYKVRCDDGETREYHGSYLKGEK